MEDQLMPIGFNEIEGEMKPTVNGRQLWRNLESKRQFTDWMKERIRKYGYKEDLEFTIHKIVKRGKSGSQILKEYYLTIDMAKELCMVENNEKGKIARQYFIECERRLKDSNAMFLSKDQYNKIVERDDGLQDRFIATLSGLNETMKAVSGAMNRMTDKVDMFDKRLNAIERDFVLHGGFQDEDKKEGLIGFVEQNIPEDKSLTSLYTDIEDNYNNIRNFIRTFCVIEKGGATQISLLYKVYAGWCYKNFMLPIGRNNFYDELKEALKGITNIIKKNSKYHMVGIHLRSDILDERKNIQ